MVPPPSRLRQKMRSRLWSTHIIESTPSPPLSPASVAFSESDTGSSSPASTERGRGASAIEAERSETPAAERRRPTSERSESHCGLQAPRSAEVPSRRSAATAASSARSAVRSRATAAASSPLPAGPSRSRQREGQARAASGPSATRRRWRGSSVALAGGVSVPKRQPSTRAIGSTHASARRRPSCCRDTCRCQPKRAAAPPARSVTATPATSAVRPPSRRLCLTSPSGLSGVASDLTP